MRFVWDPQKSEANVNRRGFNFEFAALIFTGRTLERHDTRRDYGERRIVATGMVGKDYLTIVYTDRLNITGELERRTISARPSKRRERIEYEETHNTNA